VAACSRVLLGCPTADGAGGWGVCDCPFREDLWVREGKILNPEKLFFDEKGSADIQLDCKDSIIAPGFIDVQINGTVKPCALAAGWRGVLSLPIPDLQTLLHAYCL